MSLVRLCFRRGFGLCCVVLSGCVGTTALSQLDQARPLGGPFSQALFKNYAALARSFGSVGTPMSGTPFDAAGAISLGSMSADIADIANAYAEKALATAQGQEILPEEADTNLKDADGRRVELLRDLDQGRDRTPDQAARAQADFDCWMVNARSDKLRRAADQCRRSFLASIARLESELVATAPAPAAPPAAALPAAAPATPVQTTPSQ